MKKLLITLLFLLPLTSFAALEDNLQAYYKMDSGALTTDSVAGTYTLTNVGTVAEYSSGKIGYAADFGYPNTTKYLQVDSDVGIAINSAMTISCWVKINTAPGSDPYDIVWKTEDMNPGTYTGIWYDSTPQLVIFGNSGGSYAVDMGTTNWHFLVLTRDSGTYKLYYDGADTGVTDTTYTGAYNLGEHFAIGNVVSTQGPTAHRGLGGYVDEVGVWSRALTSDEVTTLYNSGLGKTLTGGIFVDPPSAGTPYTPFWNVWIFGEW